MGTMYIDSTDILSIYIIYSKISIILRKEEGTKGLEGGCEEKGWANFPPPLFES